MNEISVISNRTYGNSKDYLPLLRVLDDNLCRGYGLGFSHKFQITDEPINKMVVTNIPKYTGVLVKPALRIIGKPKYYGYIHNVLSLDKYFRSRVPRDDSKIVLTTVLLRDTILKCKEAGKLVVVVAENSEPIRELNRVAGDYEKYGISKRYIYGDEKWQKRVNEGFRNADKLISISNASQRTFEEAGYDMDKFTLIPKNGASFKPKSDKNNGCPKAFITTAFHSFIKGTHRLLLAWKKSGIKNIPLIVVGKLCEDMQEFVEKYGPFDNVIFEGHRSDLSSWYMNWDAVGVLMSLSEGGSKVVSEMMSYGFPMLVSPDAVCDLVVDNYNGFIVDPLDEDMLVEKLRWISDNWESVNDMRVACFNSVEGKNMGDWSIEVGNYLKTLL